MKTAVITGTSSGLGEGFARALLDLGWKVYGISRREASPELMSNENFRQISMDLEKPLDKKLLSEQIQEKKIELLVNNAGLSRANPTKDWDRQLFERMFSIHYTAPIELIAYFHQSLTNAKGQIINMGSDSAFVAWYDWGSYCASKMALATHSRSYAWENPEVQVINLHPGAIDTPMIDSTEDEEMIDARGNFMKIADIVTVLLQLINGVLKVPSGADLLLFNDYETKELQYVHPNEYLYNVDTELLTKL